MSRAHIQRLHHLGGDRNAQKVLKQMEDYLHSFREERYGTVYYLSKYGRQMIGSTKRVRRTLQVIHTLMRNDFFFYMNCPAYWKNEMKVSVGEKIKVVPDAVFRSNQRYQFLEIDNTQTMADNKLKIDRYKEMFQTGMFQKQFGYFPTLHIVTVNQSRVRRFKEMCDGLPSNVYLIDNIR
ncbi:MAG TPA: replication-relaxation family protein [Candidatus Bathyarchaeia archaeon]|nr:replication-relaxation family protein [Candidatus Bathyarchaeia archaeon]